MSDFDFDEIDKAVNGALKADTTASVSEPVISKPVETPASISMPSTPTPVEPVSTPTSETTLPAARRSSGRFMDVVHPSSDMRTRSSGFTPPAPAATPTLPTPPAPVVEPENQPADASSLFEADDEIKWDMPLESPFLPDAKVEKRPLGGAPAKEEQSLLSLLDEQDDSDEPDELLLEAPDDPRLEATTMPDPIDFAAHAAALPSESEDTGVALAEPEEEPEFIEEDSEIKIDTIDEIESERPQPSEAVKETEPELFTEPEVKPEELPAVEEKSEPIGPTSITQQYTEQPGATQTSGAIYDTETYHQAIVPVVRKKSGVWTILWIILLVILGAGAGVAVYLFLLPML